MGDSVERFYCMYVRVLGDNGPLKITTYNVTWLPSGNKAFTYKIHGFAKRPSIQTWRHLLGYDS